MPRLKNQIALSVRWPHRPEDGHVLAPDGADLPLCAEAVVGSHEVKANTSYELILRSGQGHILHVSGRLPNGDRPQFFTAEAWIRCQVTENGECSYELHLGPAGMGQAKACHKGRILLHVAE